MILTFSLVTGCINDYNPLKTNLKKAFELNIYILNNISGK